MTTRRAWLRWCGSAAALAALTACGTSVVSTTPTPTRPSDPAALSVSASLREIANGVLGILPKFGLSATKVAQVKDITTKLFDIADKVSSSTDWKTYVNDALKLVAVLGPLLPGGATVAAIAAVVLEVENLTDPATAATRPLGRTAMSPAEAHILLRRAAAGQL